jgi:hypothetical protein
MLSANARLLVHYRQLLSQQLEPTIRIGLSLFQSRGSVRSGEAKQKIVRAWIAILPATGDPLP